MLTSPPRPSISAESPCPPPPRRPHLLRPLPLRLRRPRSHEFVSFEHCLKVMWHEMAHIVHGNHSAAFYQEMDDIARHYELIKSKGQLVGLDGFPIGGGLVSPCGTLHIVVFTVFSVGP